MNLGKTETLHEKKFQGKKEGGSGGEVEEFEEVKEFA